MAPVDNFFVDVVTFANSVPDEIAWAVKPLIPRGWNGFIIADPKSLKSYSALSPRMITARLRAST